jgi:hypothetical protein
MARNARSAAQVSRAGTVLEYVKATTKFGFAVRYGVLDLGRDLQPHTHSRSNVLTPTHRK